MGAIRFWLKWGGILLGGISVFNFAREIYQVSLASMFFSFIAFYESIFYPIANVVLFILKNVLFFITIPNISRDVVVIYFVIGGATTRVNDSCFPKDTNRERRLVAGIFTTAFWPLVFIYMLSSFVAFWGTVMFVSLEVMYVLFTASILFAFNYSL